MDILIAIGIILIILGLILGCIGFYKYYSEKKAGEVYEDLKVEFDMAPLIDVPQMDVEELEIPIDFANLKSQYPDVYAWITIPGTRIDYPIVQHGSDNGYYLNHTVDGRKRVEGAIYTENYNSKDFSDPNTLIYGHNMKNGSMFGYLTRYRGQGWYDTHPVMWLVTPKETYQIDVLAGRTVKADDTAYTIYNSEETFKAWLEDFVSQSISRAKRRWRT